MNPLRLGICVPEIIAVSITDVIGSYIYLSCVIIEQRSSSLTISTTLDLYKCVLLGDLFLIVMHLLQTLSHGYVLTICVVNIANINKLCYKLMSKVILCGVLVVCFV